MTFEHTSKRLLTLALLIFATLFSANSQDAKKTLNVQVEGNHFELSNATLSVTGTIEDEKLAALRIESANAASDLEIARPFSVRLKDGRIYDASNLTLDGPPIKRLLTVDSNSPRAAEHEQGSAVDLRLVAADGFALVWTVSLREHDAWIRQAITLTAAEKDLPVQSVKLIDIEVANAHVVGTVAGSPIVAENWFFGFEDPISDSKVREGRAMAWTDRELPLRAGHSASYSAVIGSAPAGQMRRVFLSYVESERAQPYRIFLHYNSWYDLGYFTPYTEADALDRINTVGRELVEKRGVQLSSYLFDDGWDDHHSLWKFNSGFPNGFAPLKAAAEKYHAEPGVWMSPWGGYSKPKDERIAFGKANNYEIIEGGYALSGPKYYEAFRSVALKMMSEYGVNQFKFDGTGNVDQVFTGSRFDSDFDAMKSLITELRAAKPSLFVNLTTGTWPSPFWLAYADSIWRGGEDDSFLGVGTDRERWITYRDTDTYQRIVQGGPLYPLNALMLHGIIYAQHHRQLSKDPGHHFRNEVRSYFGTGTALEELYITPSLLTQENWDELAEAARWAKSNESVLKDTHWIGGNPAWLEVYGWAAWSPAKATLVLRNPSDKPQMISLNLAQAFELPKGAATKFSAGSPWKSDDAKPKQILNAESPVTFSLAPFEVLTLDLIPSTGVSASH